MKNLLSHLFMTAIIINLAACSQAISPTAGGTSPSSGLLDVVATTTLAGDVVRNIGGQMIKLSVLLEPGMDPHSFQPTPQDVAMIAEADLIFMNGAGLEAFIDPLLKNSGGSARLVSLSEGIDLLGFEHQPVHEEETESNTSDPHVWMDPNNVLIWVENIVKAFADLDPENLSNYQTNAADYRQALIDLDVWVRQQVALVPPQDRKLVTDHLIFTYFTTQYGFEQIGAVVPSYNTMVEPSAQELSTLIDSIRNLGVKAIFVGDTVNPSLAQRVADDTGTSLVFVYTGSLTPADGPAATYLDYMRYNVNAIVSALR